MAREYTQRYDGEPVFKAERGMYKERCCDCGLVHDTWYIRVEGGVVVTKSRSTNSTRACRKSEKFPYVPRRGGK